MKSRIKARKKSTREQTADFSTAPAKPMFQSRPFVVQTQKTEPSQQHDLKTALKRAQRYGHHLRGPKPAGLPARTGGNETRAQGPVIQKVSISEVSSSQVPIWAATLGVSVFFIYYLLKLCKNRTEAEEIVEKASKEPKKAKKKQKKPKGKEESRKTPSGKEEPASEGEEAAADELTDEEKEDAEDLVKAFGGKYKGKEKEEQEQGPSEKKAPPTKEEAENKLQRWQETQYKRMCREIDSILEGKGDSHGSVRVDLSPRELLKIAGKDGREVKIKILDEIRKSYPLGEKVLKGPFKEAVYYHTRGTGKGGGFNLTGHKRNATVFNIHIYPS